MVFDMFSRKSGADAGAKAGAQATGGPAGPVAKDISTREFEAEVLRGSMEVPVLVDFWAPWCGPCKTLTPLLEKVVAAAKGKVRLVKINIDENQALAGQMGIQSIPTVVAFKGGRPVDGFMGALPETQLRAFIDGIVGDTGPSPADELLAAAEEAFAAGDFATAAQGYAAVLQEEPGTAAALAGLAKCYIAVGDLEHARQTLELVPPELRNDPAIMSAHAELELSSQRVDTDEVAELKRAVDSFPDDHQARYDLAVAQAANGQREDAVENLLAIIAKDREWNEQAARKQLLSIFEALGPTHELTQKGRRRLSSILFS